MSQTISSSFSAKDDRFLDATFHPGYKRKHFDLESFLARRAQRKEVISQLRQAYGVECETAIDRLVELQDLKEAIHAEAILKNIIGQLMESGIYLE